MSRCGSHHRGVRGQWESIGTVGGLMECLLQGRQGEWETCQLVVLI